MTTYYNIWVQRRHYPQYSTFYGKSFIFALMLAVRLIQRPCVKFVIIYPVKE